MTNLMLYGNGWTQRWRIQDGCELHVQDAIRRLGEPGTLQLPVIDPGTDAPTTLIVAAAMVAAAVILDDGAPPVADGSVGYA